MRGESFELCVRFAPEAATYAHERIWSEDQKADVRPDASLTLRFTAQSEAEILSWVLSFGERLTVLQPEWLQEELRRQAEAVAEKYPQRPSQD